MAVRDRGIDVVLDADIKFVPECEHGPTLLFSKFDKKTKKERQFFACSAFRDKKVCSFFKWKDDVKQCNKDSMKRNLLSLNSIYNHEAMRERFSNFKKLSQNKKCLCIECGLLLLPDDQKNHQGEGHTLKYNITDMMLSKPTELFTPLEDNKTYAQYLFSKKTVDFLMDKLQSLDVTRVLCIGCPRIHEAVQLRHKEKTFHMQSLLLDLDHRYLQTFPPGQFCWYNMLNDHFFGGDSDRTIFQHFINESSGCKVAMVTDPPFGVMVDAFCKTIDKVQDHWRRRENCDEMPVFWFFPYFMEGRINMACPHYHMLDFKVDYDNHALFCGDKGKKKGSPVRIFTNILPKLIRLPEEDGYWYCEVCGRYSAVENLHCNECKCCPTKDGSTYVHCDDCGRCVKPSRTHCNKCNICVVPGHACGQSVQQGCYICGETDHKRRECPDKGQSSISTSVSSKKRKSGGKSLQKRKKKK